MKTTDFINALWKLWIITAVIVLAVTVGTCAQDVPCSWRLKLDTIHFKKLVIVDSLTVKVFADGYIIQSVENFVCPTIRQPITDRNKKIFFQGREVEPLFLKQ